MNDHDIRSSLRPIRGAAVPETPHLHPATPEPSRVHAAPVLAAAAMLLMVLALILAPSDVGTSQPTGEIRAKLAAVEERLPKIDHPELRALLEREIELLRMELKLAE